MFNQLAKLLLVATSFAPVLLTLWFIHFSKAWDIKAGIIYLIIAVLLTILCFLILRLASERLEKIPVKITAISTSDKEITGFILAYLLPLIKESGIAVDNKILIFVMILLFISIWTTNSYHFNPVLGFFGYHFYQVTVDGGITYILITRKNITNTKKVETVVQISEYMILDAGD